MRALILVPLLQLAACDPAPPSGLAAATILASGVETQASAPRPTATGAEERVPAAHALAGALRPIDGPLPSRATLERGYREPVPVLIEIVTGGWADSTARGNALRILGFWAEEPRVAELLVSTAISESEPAPARIAALTALQYAPALVAEQGSRLRPILHGGGAGLRGAAALLLARDPGSRTELQRLADDPTTHRDVRRITKLALQKADGGG